MSSYAGIQEILRDLSQGENSELVAHGGGGGGGGGKAAKARRKEQQDKLKTMFRLRKEVEKYLNSIGCCYDESGGFDSFEYQQRFNSEYKKRLAAEKSN